MHIISIRSDIYKLKWIAVVAGDQQLQQQQQQLRRLWCMANGTCNFLSLIGWKTNAEIMISCLFFPTCFRTRIFFFSAVSCIMREYKMTGRYFNIRENDNCTKTLFQDSLANSCAFLRESPKFAHNKTALKILCTFFEIPKKKKMPNYRAWDAFVFLQCRIFHCLEANSNMEESTAMEESEYKYTIAAQWSGTVPILLY